MTTVLRIDASSRTAASLSRQLADTFEGLWRAARPADRFVRRDLVGQPVPHIAQATIEGFYRDPAARTAADRTATALSDELIDELGAADVLLLSTPMYNFTVPSALKAWIDQIVRVGRTFAVVDGGLRGLLEHEVAYVVTASGARFTETEFAAMDFLQPYLKALLQFLGVRRVEVFALEGTTMDPDAVAAARAELERRMREAVR